MTWQVAHIGAVARTDAAIAPPVPGIPPINRHTPIIWKHALTLTIQRPRPNTIRAIATSNLSDPENIYYFWYVNGTFVQRSRSPIFEFSLLDDEYLRIDVIDSTDQGFDAEAHAPDVPQSRHTVYWNPSRESTIYYRVRQKKSGGSWLTIGKVRHELGKWNYWCVTPVLDDQGTYEFDVAAVDKPGNAGTTVATDSVKVWRIPDAPAYTGAYSESTHKFTFTVT